MDTLDGGFDSLTARIHGHQAAGAQGVNTGEDIRVLEADAHGAIATHRVSCKAPALGFGDRAIVRVDIGHQIAGNKFVPVSGGDGIGIHAAHVDGVSAGHHG